MVIATFICMTIVNLLECTFTKAATDNLIDQIGTIAEDYCMSEHFQPRCHKNEVIIVRSAILGRMRIGRCITAEEVNAHKSAVGDDPRYFGCSADVLSILDEKCSGLAECDVRLSDISAQNMKPCFPGLTVFLEVTYDCINAVDEEQSCSLAASGHPLHITISTDSKRRICGTESQPWIVEAPAGQRISITLLEFGSARGNTSTPKVSQPCNSYGIIADKVEKRNVSICGTGRDRETELYKSTGNEVNVFLKASATPKNNFIYNKAMLIFTAVGCLDLIPPEDTWMKRNSEMIVIGCYTSRQTWHLVCRDGNWIGVFGNCSQGMFLHNMADESNPIKEQSWSDGQILAMIATGGLTLAICLAILCTGIICYRRFSPQKKKFQKYNTINCNVDSMRGFPVDQRFPTTTVAMERNGTTDVSIKQTPTYSVYVGESEFNEFA